MPSVVTIDARVIGQKKPLLTGVQVPFDGVGRVTLQDLITQIVLGEVAALSQRQADRRLVRFLTAQQIAQGAVGGKIEMGGSEIAPQTVDAETAVANALQALSDGLYLAFVDGQAVRQLDAELQLTSETHVSFVRLTMLAGG